LYATANSASSTDFLGSIERMPQMIVPVDMPCGRPPSASPAMTGSMMFSHDSRRLRCRIGEYRTSRWRMFSAAQSSASSKATR
jgi:hypothetical protein